MSLRTLFSLSLCFTLAACGDSSGGTDGSGGTGGSSGASSDGSSGGSAGSSSGATSSPTSGGTGGGSEGSTGGGSDGSTGGSAGSTGGSTGMSPFDFPPMCSSGITWNKGEIEDPHMHPGRICLDCHMNAPNPFIKNRFQIAGTVYPTGHEPDDCYGINGVAMGIEVEVTDAMNQGFTMPVNEAGNFMQQALPGTVVFPITALVRRGGDELKMTTPQNTADCNSCHTQDGTNNALGRIVAP
jgi:hypothetical protein